MSVAFFVCLKRDMMNFIKIFEKNVIYEDFKSN